MNTLNECPVCHNPADGAKMVHTYDHGHQAQGIKGYNFETTLVACRSCDHVFTNPQPTWEELAPAYGAGTMYQEHHGESGFDFKKVDSLIARSFDGTYFNHIPVVKGGRYLDVGSGDGLLVAGMARLGMLAEGVEPRADAVEECRKAGLKVTVGTLEDAHFPDDSFDCMSLNHVLEHVPDPVALIRECRRVLKPGGTLMVGVPNYRSLLFGVVGWTWIGLDPPRHLHQFHDKSLRSVFEQAGLRVESIESESLLDFVEAELSRWLRYRAFVPRRLTLKTHATRPIAALLTRRGNASLRGESLVIRGVK